MLACLKNPGKVGWESVSPLLGLDVRLSGGGVGTRAAIFFAVLELPGCRRLCRKNPKIRIWPDTVHGLDQETKSA